MKVLAIPTLNGTLSVLIPAPGFTLSQALENPDVQAALAANQSAGEPVQIEDTDLPQDRMFRDAWTVSGTECVECPVKSKGIAHDIRRQKRAAEFEPHDKIVSLQLPGAVEAEQARAAIRNKYAHMQASINSASSVDQLRALLSDNDYH